MFSGKKLLDYAYIIFSNKYDRESLYFRWKMETCITTRKIDQPRNCFIKEVKQKDYE